MASISVICRYQPRHKQTTSSYYPCPENIFKYFSTSAATMSTRGDMFTMQTSARLWQWAGKHDVPPTHHPYFVVSPTYTHLGIVQSGGGRYPFNPDDEKQVIRGTYFALSNVLSNTGDGYGYRTIRLYVYRSFHWLTKNAVLWYSLEPRELSNKLLHLRL